MPIAVVTRDDLPLILLGPSPKDNPHLLVTDDPALQRRARRLGFRTLCGDLGTSHLYRRARIGPNARVLLHLPGGDLLDRAVGALFRAHPATVATVLLGPRQTPPARWRNRLRFLQPHELSADPLDTQLRRTETRRDLETIRNLFGGADRVLLLVQDDPDPDGLASALALRALLKRNRLTAVVGSFGQVHRPENVAMTHMLDIQVEELTPELLGTYDRIALLDVQPFHSPCIPTEVDLVIDHHPRRNNYQVRFADVRPRYGATSTIMTQYLLASETPISQRLATALLYGIKTDTQLLGRDTTPMDVAAFSALYPLANHSLLRRIDRPQFPRGDIPSLRHAFQHADLVDDILFAYLGPLTREDVVPFIADFCLGIEGVEWSVVSGIFGGQLTISVRTYGGGRNAGEVMKTGFEPYGSAGGHKAMAKAVIPLDQIPPDCLEHGAWVRDRFLVSLYERGSGACIDRA